MAVDPWMRPSRARRSRIWPLISWRSSWLGAMTPVFSRASGPSLSQRAATAPAILSCLTSATLPPSFSKARSMSPLRLATTASFRAGSRWRMISSMTAVFMPGGLELGEGLAGIDRIELLRIADQHHAGDTNLVRDPEQVAGLHGGRQRALVDHQDRLREGGAHLLRALLREPALGNARVAREEHLEGFALDAGFGRQRLHRRGRGGRGRSCGSPSSPRAPAPGRAWWSCRNRHSPGRRPRGPPPTGSASRRPSARP